MLQGLIQPMGHVVLLSFELWSAKTNMICVKASHLQLQQPSASQRSSYIRSDPHLFLCTDPNREAKKSISAPLNCCFGTLLLMLNDKEHTRNFSIFVHRILNSTNPSLALPSFFRRSVKNDNTLNHTYLSERGVKLVLHVLWKVGEKLNHANTTMSVSNKTEKTVRTLWEHVLLSYRVTELRWLTPLMQKKTAHIGLKTATVKHFLLWLVNTLCRISFICTKTKVQKRYIDCVSCVIPQSNFINPRNGLV